MGHANRVVGYLASVATASLFYVVWLMVRFGFVPHEGGRVGDFLSSFRVAAFIWVVSGMGATFVLMTLPWFLAVRAYGRLQSFPLIYFLLFGSTTAFLIGCGATSMVPRPRFFRDDTFLGGFMNVAQGEGFCLLLTGFVFGLTFWLVSERLRPSRCIKAS
jgi:hypothetical protein